MRYLWSLVRAFFYLKELVSVFIIIISDSLAPFYIGTALLFMYKCLDDDVDGELQ